MVYEIKWCLVCFIHCKYVGAQAYLVSIMYYSSWYELKSFDI